MDIRRYLRNPGRGAASLASRLVFIGILGVLMVASVAANSVLMATLAALAAGIMLRSILPTDRFKARMMWLWTGEAGEEAYEDTQSLGSRVRRRFDR